MYYFVEYTTFDVFFSLKICWKCPAQWVCVHQRIALYKSYQLLLCGIFAPEMPQNYFCKKIFIHLPHWTVCLQIAILQSICVLNSSSIIFLGIKIKSLFLLRNLCSLFLYLFFSWFCLEGEWCTNMSPPIPRRFCVKLSIYIYTFLFDRHRNWCPQCL